MRQVPAHYLIIGRGRLASHLVTYLRLLNVPFQIWTRDNSFEELKNWSNEAQRILIAIKDDVIESFIADHQLTAEKNVHFSGTLSIASATRLHPLMTFAKNMYALEDYKKIPFVGEQGAASLQTLIPELPNPYFVIPKNEQDLYHALCVLAGNGTVVLWQEIFKKFEESLQLPKEVLLPYLERVCKNLAEDSANALTGPWVRGDAKTIAKNQVALKDTPFSPIYFSLLNAYQSPRPQNVDTARSFQ